MALFIILYGWILSGKTSCICDIYLSEVTGLNNLRDVQTSSLSNANMLRKFNEMFGYKMTFKNKPQLR